MKNNYKRGFTYKGLKYAWKDEKQTVLVRLPYTKGNRTYGTKTLSIVAVGNHYGYRLSGYRKTIAQLRDLTKEI